MMSIHHNKTAFYRRFISIVLIGLGCGGIIIVLLCAGMLREIELKSLDFRFLCRGSTLPSNKIVIIGTDEESLDKIDDPFIFCNPYFAEIIKAVSAGGAKTIGLDFLQTIALKKKVDGED